MARNRSPDGTPAPTGFWLTVAWLVIAACGGAVAHLGWPVLLLAGGFWWLASLLAARGVGSTRAIVLGSIALRAIVLLGGDPGLSDDLPRYVFEGQMVARGFSPYSRAPDAPELEEVRQELPQTYLRMNNPDVSAAYPPVFQLAASAALVLTRALHPAVGESGLALAMRGLFTACDLLVLAPLWLLLRKRALPSQLLLVWGWSPLAAIEFAGSGHFDSLALGLWLTALVLFLSDRRVLGSLALAAAILTKYLPALSAPFLLRRRPLASLSMLVVFLALGFAPFLALGDGRTGFFRGLSQYAQRWESTSLVYRFFELPFAAFFARDGSSLDPRHLGRLLAVALWCAYLLWLWLRSVDPLSASGRLVNAFLVLTPTLHPWYVTWAVAFLPFSSARAWPYLAVVAPMLYAPIARWKASGEWIEPVWLWPAVALPFFALLLLDGIQQRGIHEGRGERGSG